MRNVLKASPLLACLIFLIGCDQRRTQPAVKAATHEDPLVQDIKQMEYGVRLSAAAKRIDELERKVAALEATPEKLDLELLTQRVTALEVKSVGDEATVSQAAPASKASQPMSGTPRTGSESRRSPNGNSKLTLPELENRPHLATPAEAKAFSREK